MLFQGQTLGKYKILSPLGSGGFGAVYLARDTWIDKEVAIKVPHRQNLNFSELLREPRLLAALDHPNIVSITTAEKQENVFFIVMEYVSGDTLEEIIATGGALDVPLTIDYACQICEAVEHAHRQGVIHRDLRPPNVLVSETGVLKVADFGTSRFLEMAAHGTTVIGQPAVYGPGAIRGQGGLRLGPLLVGRHHVSDADRLPPVRHAGAERSRQTDAWRAGPSPEGADPVDSEVVERHRHEGHGSRHPEPIRGRHRAAR